MSPARIAVGFGGIWLLAGAAFSLIALHQWKTFLPWLLIVGYCVCNALALGAVPLVKPESISPQQRRKRMRLTFLFALLTVALLSLPRLLLSGAK